MKKTNKLSLTISMILLFFTISTTFVFAKAKDLERWSNFINIEQYTFKHKFIFIDRNGDGKYDYVKNYVYWVKNNGEYVLVKSWDLAFKIKARTESEVEYLNDKLQYPGNEFSIINDNLSIDDINKHNYSISICKAHVDDGNSESNEDNMWGVISLNDDSYVLTRVINDLSESLQIMKKHFVEKYIPNSSIDYSNEDFYNNYDEISNTIQNSKIEIKVGNFFAKAISKIEVLDSNGNIVLSVHHNKSNEISMDIASISDGIYSLKIEYLSGYCDYFSFLKN